MSDTFSTGFQSDMMEVIILHLLLFKFSAFFTAASQSSSTESFSQNQKYFTKASGQGKWLWSVLRQHSIVFLTACKHVYELKLATSRFEKICLRRKGMGRELLALKNMNVITFNCRELQISYRKKYYLLHNRAVGN